VTSPAIVTTAVETLEDDMNKPRYRLAIHGGQSIAAAARPKQARAI